MVQTHCRCPLMLFKKTLVTVIFIPAWPSWLSCRQVNCSSFSAHFRYRSCHRSYLWAFIYWGVTCNADYQFAVRRRLQFSNIWCMYYTETTGNFVQFNNLTIQTFSVFLISPFNLWIVKLAWEGKDASKIQAMGELRN